MHLLKDSLKFVALLVVTAGFAHSDAHNLLSNSDFSKGNVGFTSGYTLFTDGTELPDGYYSIEYSPREHHPLQADIGDHTTGNGLMMVVNGSTTGRPLTKPVWGETVNVTAGQTYTFAGWVTSADSLDTFPANLVGKINGQTVLTNFTEPEVAGDWKQFTATWRATSSVANLQLFDTNNVNNGNDFCLDDMYFGQGPAPVPEPAPVIAMISGLIVTTLLKRRR